MSASKKCRLCAFMFNIMSRECPRCGATNEQFFNMPESSREAFVEFYHDRDIYRTMEKQATREGCSVEDLYRKAAEFYLDHIATKSRRN